tara:strand:+ start:268 stop:465 length:198 start_codon:yes stop_codon:yes gene_type:complete
MVSTYVPLIDLLMTIKYSIKMSRADWENIVQLIGNTEPIGILGVDPEPYKSADELIAAVKALPSD